MLTTGKVRCWGFGWYGQLGYPGNGNIGDNETPASAGDVNVGDTVLQIVASKTEDDRWGSSYTCALLSTGDVKCWGINGEGQLGYGHTTQIGDNELPSTAGDIELVAP